MTRLQQIGTHGQSVWLDFISRKTIHDGTLQKFIDEGVAGMTSNPAIFGKAMSAADYDPDIATFAIAGKSALEIYDELAVADVRAASELLEPVFHKSGGQDGFVSLEVSPLLAKDTAGTVADAKRYWKWLNRPNVMIKIPATEEGLPAIADSLAAGININVTLLFSVSRYEGVIEAFMDGLERLIANGGDPTKIRSVASFFLSRIDTLVDEELGADHADLKGTAALASAKEAYAAFQRHFSSPRWLKLQEKGAHVQRLLWASTSTKNPAYPDLMYVEPLIGPETVNTMPQETIAAYLDHGQPADRIEEGIHEAAAKLAKLEKAGINMAQVAIDLEEEGLKKFVGPYHDIEALLDKKRKAAAEAGSVSSAVAVLAGGV